MKKQSVAVMQPAKEAAPMKLLPGSDLFDRIQDMSNSIARRAFEIFEDRGRAFGHDLEDWLRAESEFLHPFISTSQNRTMRSRSGPRCRDSAPKNLRSVWNPIVLPSAASVRPTKNAKAKRPSTRNTAETKSSARSNCLRRLTLRRLRPPSRMECWNSRCRRSTRRRRSGWKKSRRKAPLAPSGAGDVLIEPGARIERAR